MNLCLTGPGAQEVAVILNERLTELKTTVGIDITVRPKPGKAPSALVVALDPHDTPDFAAEKIIDMLGEAGAVLLERADYTPEEEEQIRQRLKNLGYIE